MHICNVYFVTGSAWKTSAECRSDRAGRSVPDGKGTRVLSPSRESEIVMLKGPCSSYCYTSGQSLPRDGCSRLRPGGQEAAPGAGDGDHGGARPLHPAQSAQRGQGVVGDCGQVGPYQLQLWHSGGLFVIYVLFRIEDDILITEDGVEILSKACPKTVSEISELIR